MPQCPGCGKRIPYSLIGSRPIRRKYFCKDCRAKFEVERFSYLFRLAEILTVSSMSIFFSFLYSTIRQSAKHVGPLHSSLVFLILFLVLVLPVDYLVWRYVVKFKKTRESLHV